MYKAIPELFFESVKKYSKRTALSYKKEGVYFPVTYNDLAKKVAVFAGALQNLGIAKGDKIAILSENRPEWVIADLAIMAIGAISVPLHTTFSPKAICNVINHCEAKIVIISNNELLNKVLIGQRELKRLEKIIFLEKITAVQKESFTNKIFSWNAIFSAGVPSGSGPASGWEKIFLDPDDPCSIIYTSGTTGAPKGVVLTHRNFLSNVEAVSEFIPVKESDVFLSFLPLSHVLERLGGYYMPLMHGAKIVYSEGIKQLPQNMKEARPTIMISVPRVFEKFHDAVWDKINSGSAFQKNIFKWALKQKKGALRYKMANFLVFKKIRQRMGGRLRLTISGGAALNENIGRFFSKIGIIIYEGYGLTETSPVIAVNYQGNLKFGTVGKVVPGVKVKIAENKEILVKGPSVFTEYLNNEKESKECFTNDGWFCTGDLGFVDKEGFLTVIGRATEMIVTSGGKNVWPEKIENVLNNDRFISQSMVMGNNRRFVLALIVPDWQEIEMFLKEKNLPMQERDSLVKNQIILSLFQERMDEKINPNLNDYEKIKKFKLMAQEFSQSQDELTPTLKLRRHIIEQHYQKSIESIYE